MHSDAALYTSPLKTTVEIGILFMMRIWIQYLQRINILIKMFIEPKIFENNIAEYVFRMLYESTDKIMAINMVLELVGKHYDVNAYVLETDCVGNTMSNTFEWCSYSKPQINSLQTLRTNISLAATMIFLRIEFII